MRCQLRYLLTAAWPYQSLGRFSSRPGRKSNSFLALGSEKGNTMLQLSPSTDRRAPRTAPAIDRRDECECVVPAGMVQAGADVVRRRSWDPITIGMLAGGPVLAAVGVAVAASYSYTHPAGLAVSMIWWGIYCGAFGASIGALPGLFTQRHRARTRAKKNPPRVSGSRPPDSVS